jgi:hypothetical protein
VQCKGGCEGKATPPSVSAECQASVEAKANASVECTPPELDAAFQLKAGLGADAQAEFLAWLGNFKGQYAAALAAGAKADVLLVSITDLKAAGEGAVKGAVESLKGEANLKVSIGAACALAELPDVGSAFAGAADGLTASIAAVGEIGSVGGG